MRARDRKTDGREKLHLCPFLCVLAHAFVQQNQENVRKRLQEREREKESKRQKKTKRQREREREKELHLCLFLCVLAHTFVQQNQGNVRKVNNPDVNLNSLLQNKLFFCVEF